MPYFLPFELGPTIRKAPTFALCIALQTAQPSIALFTPCRRKDMRSNLRRDYPRTYMRQPQYKRSRINARDDD
jgi:hypothetical protein